MATIAFMFVWFCPFAFAEKIATPTTMLDPVRILLGEKLFNDSSLSEPEGQSCASCHAADKAFADPANAIISPGAAVKFSNRNAPSLTYAPYIPEFHFIDSSQKWAGGQFWDGRANTLQEQAEGPLFNPLEMNNTRSNLIKKLAKSPYRHELTQAYGQAIWQKPSRLIAAVADALSQFQKSDRMAPRFTSKFDAWLDKKVEITEQERRGMFVFQDQGKCLNCHPVFGSQKPILFSDFTYHNIGVPKNPASPFLLMGKSDNPAGGDYIDVGLALNPRLPKNQVAIARGKFRTPSLRNVALTAPYMHNGVFSSLREVVEFYNSRDTAKERWGAPEVAANMDTQDTGNLQLSDDDIDAIVAFMNILTDGYQTPTKTEQGPTEGEEP